MNRDVEFLFEMGSLRHVPRMWQRFLGVDFANVTEHHYHVMWIALTIAAREGVTNTDKILKMALVHDIAESRTGDVDYISRQYMDRHEDEAMHDILEKTSLEKEFLDLIAEYEKRECIEAKIVKDADNLDVDMELRERAMVGDSLEKRFSPMRKRVAETKLYTKTAKELHAQIIAADPHDWHANAARNRINGGDWKNIK
jgi:putative hydrolase of HD superfamily